MRTAGPSILGTRSVVNIDRAIVELRRGRAVRVVHPDGAAVAVAVEAASATAIDELAILSSEPSSLIITRQRAAALGLGNGGAEPLALPIPPPAGMAWADQLTMSKLADEDARTQLAGLCWRPAAPAEAAALQLTKLAQLLPAVLAIKLNSANTNSGIGHTHLDNLLTARSDDIATYPREVAKSLTQVGEAWVPLVGHENCRFIMFRTADGKVEHLAIVIGDPDRRQPVPVRLHSACLTGDLFGSLRCDCGAQLHTAVEEIAEAGGGVLLYLAQEGRGIGLANKLRAYRLQDCGLDTLEANQELGFEPDERSYDIALEMLQQLNINRICLLTNNPAKLRALSKAGMEMAGRIPLITTANPHNARYLRTKAERAGHLFGQSTVDGSD